MPIHRDKLVLAALCVLDEAVERCHDTPIKPSIGLRFALSYLYSVSSGERHQFANFVQAIQDDVAGTSLEGERRYIRSTHARGCLLGIFRAVGYPLTPEAAHKIRRHRIGEA